MQYLRQSTASQPVLLGPFVDSTDGVTAETGLTINASDIRLSANGGNMAAKNSGGGTHDENGWYQITLDATDTATVGRLQVSCVVSGALPVWKDFQVLEEAVYDALFAANATGDLDVNVASWNSVALSTTNPLPNAAPASNGGLVTGDANNRIAGIQGTLTTLDALDTAQDTQHSSTQTAVSNLSNKIGTVTDLGDGATIAGNLTAMAGSTFDSATDSLEAIKDSGGGGLDAAGVRAAVGLASANLDTQLADIPTVAEFEARTLAAASYFDPSTDVVTANVTQINGTAITGTGSQVAAAFEHFFDVATPSKTVNDVGVAGSGITAQEVRDAMKLAPSAGAAAAGSIDAKVDTVDGIVDEILLDTGTSLPAALSMVEDNLDEVNTSVLAILEDTGTTIPAALTQIDFVVDTILIDTNELQTDWADGGRLDLLLDSAASGGGGGGDATAANQTTIITHLTDIKGATFSGSTDSLEAIRDRGDAAWVTGGGGSGLYTLTVTVADSDSNALAGARVNIDGTSQTLTTPTNGIVSFNLDSGDYTLVVSPPAGYQTPSNTDIAISADASTTITLTAGSGGVGWLG